MSLGVHLLLPPRADEALRHLEDNLLPAVRLTLGADLPSPAEFHILVAGRPERKHLIASQNLRAVIVPWAGIPEPTSELMREFPDIALHNLHHNALPVAEQAMALLLTASKFTVPMDRSLRTGDWRPRYNPNPSLLLNGRTALVLGYGAIGKEVARLCLGWLGSSIPLVVRHTNSCAASKSSPRTSEQKVQSR